MLAMIEDKYLEQLVPLTTKEEAKRKELEEKFFTVVKAAYIDMGELLSEIKELKLYKSTHHTFADYSREILDMAKQSAYRYIGAYGVVKNLSAIADNSESEKSPIGDFLLPKNESQARALVGIPPEEQRKVWREAVASAPEGKITAAHVRKTVRLLKGKQTVETIKKTKRPKAPNGSRKSEEFEAAFNAFKDAIQAEIFSNWKTTDRLTVVTHLDTIRGVISQNGNHRIPDPGYAIEASNTEKLINAGFTIYRQNPVHLTIEKMVGNRQWAVFEAYNNVEEMNRMFDHLMLDLKNLRG